MRKIIFFITLFFVVCGINNHATTQGQGMSKTTADGTVPAALTKLARDIDESVVNTWQKALQVFERWGRKPGVERWDLKQLNLSSQQQANVIRDLTELGFIDAITPQKNTYDYAFILGATVKSMMQRLDYLVKQWNNGTRFSKLVFLTGERPLLADSDNFAALMCQHNKQVCSITWDKKTLPNSESEAARLIHAYFNMPDEMRAIPVLFVSVPRTWQKEQAQWQRPNTAMTVKALLQKENLSSRTILSVSSQPYAQYQHLVLHNCLQSKQADNVSIETIAAATDNENLQYKLDAVWLWIKNQIAAIPKNIKA
ncbi:MAG: hypothetical protein OXD32_09030 [Endozoicomonadaceae bacterium]|nr:hypothetical protein [Endozoicomonadaceae bacterium]